MKQSLLFFAAATLCAASAVTSTLIGLLPLMTAVAVGLAALTLWLGLRSRGIGN